MKNSKGRHFLAGCCFFVASAAQASTWIPVHNGIGNQYLSPRPSLSGVETSAFQYGSKAEIPLAGLGETSQVYYQIRQWQNGSYNTPSDWVCVQAL